MVNHKESVLVQEVDHECEGDIAIENLHEFKEGFKEIIGTIKGKNVSYISELSRKIFKEGSPIVCEIEVEELIGPSRGL